MTATPTLSRSKNIAENPPITRRRRPRSTTILVTGLLVVAALYFLVPV
jgi:multiple sugar transport system permease protein